ncbi:MAG: hypothetical protein HOM68_12795 [Gemmatimonadetes bacterium]|jgi:septal ring factor EnvC (AmiA/AmiB activator)|nr:hypothetical protein [Gemmatimonadota bacterium]MBT4611734.1 hypothetical protein [Gemmatimonadota bacterium]MBT5057413.1 hypothetical protein [Gemmatimonadota bacterium]MBT5145167.1 hypothetical protein [Gemmatimonadota bacterium]MBT5592007.1 hypothetical protein [Gemmatimonadota bacterium]
MIIWVFLGVGIALLGVSVKMWVEFGQRSRQLMSETAHARSLIDNHKETLEMVEAKIKELKAETELLLKEREAVEGEVQDGRAKLTAVEERLERAKPAKFRVDKDGAAEELF